MNELQRRLLNIIQGRFPIEAGPFAALAAQLDTTEEDIICQVEQLKESGIIRRVGPVFDAAYLGYVSTLVAVQVPSEQIDAFVADVNALPGVSHNYGRDHKFNVWFTLTMDCQGLIDNTLERLRLNHKLPAIYSLPAEKLFKINVNFDFVNRQQRVDCDDPVIAGHPVTRPDLSDFQIALIRRLQEDLPVVSRPFDKIAHEIHADVDEVIRQILAWQSSGVMRRFGASIHHQNAGFRANGMVVFETAPEDIDTAGTTLAGFPQVSHCYQRPAVPGWPYNLFAMTHCRSDDELRDVTEAMVAQINPKQYDIVLSTAEYKKDNVRYFTE